MMVNDDIITKIYKNELMKYMPLWDNAFSMRNEKTSEIVTMESGEVVRGVKRKQHLFLFLDTCVWINLAKKGKIDSYAKIIELHLQFDAMLLIPEQLLIEWDRNKERSILKDHSDSYIDMINKAKRLEAVLSNSDQDTTVLKANIIEAERMKIELVDEIAKSSMAITEYVMDVGYKIPTTDAFKIKTADIALQKKAPFHKNKNSFGDALLFISCMEYLDSGSELYFITDNKTDFSSESPTDIHPELYQMAEDYGIKIHYSLDPDKTLDEIIQRVTDTDYIERLEQKYIDERKKNLPECEKCGQIMIIGYHPFNGRGSMKYFICDKCSYTYNSGSYREDDWS
ncbi:PIN domain-containing protein [Paenibacillus polymyxa]